MSGYLYLATNPVMPGLTKIGFTETVLSERFSDLQSTGVPVPFELFAAFYVGDPRSCEKAVHGALVAHRVSENREFFRISPKAALSRVMPLLLGSMPDSEKGETSVNAFGDLDEDERQMLAAYTMAPSFQRPHTWEWLDRMFGLGELDARHVFHSLRQKGYLREIRGTGGAILYDLTPRGVQYGREARNNPEFQNLYGNDRVFFHGPR